MFSKLLQIFLTILHFSHQLETFGNFLQLFTGCTLEIFTSKTYPYDDPRFWISDESLIFPRSVKDIKTYVRLVSDAQDNNTLEKYLLLQKQNMRLINSSDYCRIGFIDLQERDEKDVPTSANGLLQLILQNPPSHHVFIRVGIPAAANFPKPNKSPFDYVLRKVSANIFYNKILKSHLSYDSMSKTANRWQNLATSLQSKFTNMGNSQNRNQGLRLSYIPVDRTKFFSSAYANKLNSPPAQVILPAGDYLELKTVVFSKKQEPNGFALLTSFDSCTWICLFLLLFCLNMLLNLPKSGYAFPWYVSFVLVGYLMDQPADIPKPSGQIRSAIIRTAIFSTSILAMLVGNLFRGAYTSQLTARTLPIMKSDLNSLAFSSAPIVTTAFSHSVTNTRKFESFLTNEIRDRLIVAPNSSNIYNVLKIIKDRTTFLLSSWYDFAFNVSNNHLTKTSNGYERLSEVFVLMDQDASCNALIKLLTFNNVYFPISYRSSGIYTERDLYIASNTLLGRILTRGLYGLEESGILHWWKHRHADRSILSPHASYTRKNYFGTWLHRALIHWPPKKSPEFEKDVVGLGNFLMFGYILIILYFWSGLLVRREVCYHRKTREKILNWFQQMWQADKLWVKAYAKKSAPKHTEGQTKMVNAKHPRLYNKMSATKMSTDDESNVLENVTETPGRQFYHGKYVSQLKIEEKLKRCSKFLKKSQIWQGLGQFGHFSDP
ncbi:hypothetical protein Fcan01_19171 [Folsomia candida]|uniref:Uncharacterized protein n=1 Tax=Folsomia candida TaxID=158441 RepID=A0A226DM42_FOLCA|nr:hypothetical protein Fcan01_19171 [Folsomia candida]